MARQYYFIKSKLSQLVLDVTGGCVEEAAEVITWDKKSENFDNQLWYTHPITNTIRSKLNNYCLEIDDGSLIVNPFDSGKDGQKLKWDSEKIVNVPTGKVLDIADCNTSSCAKICLWEYNGGDNQHWICDCLEKRFFRIKSKMNGKVLDIKGAKGEQGDKVIMYPAKAENYDNQLWYEDEFGLLRSKLNNLAMDTSSGKLQVNIADPNSDAQKWAIDEEVIINADDHGSALDIKGNNDDDGADVISWDLHRKSNQCWEFIVEDSN